MLSYLTVRHNRSMKMLSKTRPLPSILILILACSSRVVKALAVNWANENIPAIVQLWYPGQEGGTALADVLFGDYNPADSVSSFDEQYRLHLGNLYSLLGEEPPEYLSHAFSHGSGSPAMGGVMLPGKQEH